MSEPEERLRWLPGPVAKAFGRSEEEGEADGMTLNMEADCPRRQSISLSERVKTRRAWVLCLALWLGQTQWKGKVEQMEEIAADWLDGEMNKQCRLSDLFISTTTTEPMTAVFLLKDFELKQTGWFNEVQGHKTIWKTWNEYVNPDGF